MGFLYENSNANSIVKGGELKALGTTKSLKSVGCSIAPEGRLSPLMAALYLKPLDDALSKHGFYVRFMDDWVVMVKTRHQLRKVIKLTYKILGALKIKMHPEKTFFGWITLIVATEIPAFLIFLY